MGEERESAYRRLVKRELDRVVEGMGIQPGRTHWEKVSPHGFVDPVKASSGESPEVKIDLDRPVGLRWDFGHDVGAKALSWKRADKSEHWYDDGSGLRLAEPEQSACCHCYHPSGVEGGGCDLSVCCRCRGVREDDPGKEYEEKTHGCIGSVDEFYAVLRLVAEDHVRRSG